MNPKRFPNQLFAILRENWLWWLIPIALIFGGFALFMWWTDTNGAAPFVY